MSAGGWLFIFSSRLLAVIHSDLHGIELRCQTCIFPESLSFVKKMSPCAATAVREVPFKQRFTSAIEGIYKL